jgi:hypothetical protein
VADDVEAPARAVLRALAGRSGSLMRPVRIDSAFAERLAAVDQVRIGWLSLRVGWLFMAGTVTGDNAAGAPPAGSALAGR